MGTQPVSIVIFGITGDLSRAKLIPALFDLFCKDMLPEDFSLIGYGRKKFSKEEFHSFVLESIENKTGKVKTALLRKRQRFIGKCSYIQGELDTEKGYNQLRFKLDKDKRVIYFLAVHPELHQTIVGRLGKEKILSKNSQIMIEKPFGHGATSAKALDLYLRKFVNEEQIYRIDHYLGKSVLIELLERRRRDEDFEKILENEIKEIRVSLWEKKTIAGRGTFYDAVGTLKDVGQNHLLQMLAVVLAEKNITSDDARKVQKARADAVASLRLLMPAARAQYKKYHEEPGVDPHSETETFFSIHAVSDLPKHKDINLILSAGKALSENKADIEILFKKEVSLREGLTKGITFSLNPELGEGSKIKKTINAYEQIFMAALHKDQRFFCSIDESISGWKFDDSVRKFWKKNKIPLKHYEIGEAIHIPKSSRP